LAGLAEILAYFRLSRKFCGVGSLTKTWQLSRGLFSIYFHSHMPSVRNPHK